MLENLYYGTKFTLLCAVPLPDIKDFAILKIGCYLNVILFSIFPNLVKIWIMITSKAFSLFGIVGLPSYVSLC